LFKPSLLLQPPTTAITTTYDNHRLEAARTVSTSQQQQQAAPSPSQASALPAQPAKHGVCGGGCSRYGRAGSGIGG